MSQLPFRLEPVLRIRRATRQQRQADLAATQQAIREVDGELDRLSSEVHQQREGTRQQLSAGPLDMPAILDTRLYEAALHRELTAARQRRDGLEQELERRRAALRSADSEVRAIEKVSDRRPIPPV
jgi:flagellar export protein FliJ